MKAETEGEQELSSCRGQGKKVIAGGREASPHVQWKLGIAGTYRAGLPVKALRHVRAVGSLRQHFPCCCSFNRRTSQGTEKNSSSPRKEARVTEGLGKVRWG